MSSESDTEKEPKKKLEHDTDGVSEEVETSAFRSDVVVENENDNDNFVEITEVENENEIEDSDAKPDAEPEKSDDLNNKPHEKEQEGTSASHAESEDTVICGLSSKNANKKLTEHLESALHNYAQKSSFSGKNRQYLRSFNYCATTVSGAVTIFAFILLLVSVIIIGTSKNFDDPEKVDTALWDFKFRKLVAECVLLVLSFAINVYMHYTLQYRKTFEIAFKVQKHIDYFKKSGDPLLQYDIDGIGNSVTLISVLRDSLWRKIPVNLLVQGDIVGLLPDEEVPKHVVIECIHEESGSQGAILKPGQKYLDLQSSKQRKSSGNKRHHADLKTHLLTQLTERIKFKCIETPSVNQLKIALESQLSSTSPIGTYNESHSFYITPSEPDNGVVKDTPFDKHIKIALKIFNIAQVVMILLSFAVNIIRFIVTEKDEKDLSSVVQLILVRQGYVVLPLTLMLFHPFYFIAQSSCNALLFERIYALQSKAAAIKPTSNPVTETEEPDATSQAEQHQLEDESNAIQNAAEPNDDTDNEDEMEDEELNAEELHNINADNKNKESEYDPEVGNPTEEDLPEAEIKKKKKKTNYKDISFRNLSWYLMRLIMFGDAIGCTVDHNMTKVLGSITIICSIDKDGVVAEPTPQPEKIFLYKSSTAKNQDQLQENIKQDNQSISNNASSEQQEMPQALLQYTDGGVILGLSLVHEFSKIQHRISLTFDDMDWHQHMTSLKPIGLNVLLNKTCRHPDDLTEHDKTSSTYDKLLSIRQREDVNNMYNTCFCLLGKEIGFSNEVTSMFVKLKEIHSFAPKLKKTGGHYMWSLVVSDHDNQSLQLLSRGTPKFVLHHCTAFWDGETIQQLTEQDKNRIMETCSKWVGTDLNVICLAYRPIDNQYRNLFPPHSNETTSSEDSIPKIPIAIQLQNKAINDIITIDDTPQESNPGASAPIEPSDDSNVSSFNESNSDSSSRAITLLQRDQIFIGMLAIRSKPKPATNNFVEKLKRGGIRYVLFTSLPEAKIKVFADKIGLETDWNCCISLKEKQDPARSMRSVPSDLNPLAESNEIATTPDDTTQDVAEDTQGHPIIVDPYWDNPAHLPHGIPEIRKHLENDVDNVPLLVPMFSDAVPDSIRDMIGIYQEHGEIVCCIGSALNSNNTEIFASANIAIAIEPQLRTCLMDPADSQRSRKGTSDGNMEGKSEGTSTEDDAVSKETKEAGYEELLLSSNNLMHVGSSESLSCDLTSLPCAFVLHRRTPIGKMLRIMKIARILLDNLTQCVWFYLLTVAWIQSVIFFSYVFLPSEIEILSGYQIFWLCCVIIPLLSLSILLSKGQRQLMNVMPAKNEFRLSLIRQSSYLMLTRLIPSTCVSLFLFIWCMFLLWKDATKSRIFGNDSKGTDYQSANFRNSLLYSQNILMITLTYHMIAMSFGFIYQRQRIFKRRVMVQPTQLVFFCVCMILQVAFFVISVSAGSSEFLLGSLDWEYIIVVILWPACVTLLEELLKKKQKLWFTRFQKQLKLEFDTRLGQYSPR